MNELVEHRDLRKGDRISFIYLQNGKTEENVSVHYVSIYDNGFTFNRKNGTSGTVNKTSDVIIVRTQHLPKNWPPKNGDVWRGLFCEYHVLIGVVFDDAICKPMPLANFIDEVERGSLSVKIIYRKT